MPEIHITREPTGTKNRLSEGGTAFAVPFANIAFLPPGTEFGPMARPWGHQFTWVIEGGGVVTVDGTEYDARPGDIFLEPKGELVHYKWTSHEPTIHGYYQFVLEPEEAFPPAESWPKKAHASSDTDLLHVLPQYLLDIYVSTHEGRDLLLSSALALLLHSFVCRKTQPSAEMRSALPRAVIKAMERMHTMVGQGETELGKITIGDLARHAHVAKGSLCRLFRQHLDATPMQCLRALRLDRAASLLTGSDMSVKEISRAVGFASQFNLSRRFREEYQVSPTEYRRRTRRGEYIGGSSIRLLMRQALYRTYDRLCPD